MNANESLELTIDAPNNSISVFDIYYQSLMFTSFVTCVLIHHFVSPRIFRHNEAYKNLTRSMQMEWDSRVVSTIHATSVSILCVLSLVLERQLWYNPFEATGDLACTTLSISLGYFLCDIISMPIYYRGKNLLIFVIHHLMALISFYLIMVYQVGMFFGIYRLTTELSTPFTNQRWFYRTLGYTPNRRRVASVTLVFSIFFCITRNILVIPYWLIIYSIYDSPSHLKALAKHPLLDTVWFSTSLVVDALNTYWAIQVYPIGYKAAYLLYTADWRTDINLARARIHRRFLNVRRHAMSTKIVDKLRRTASYNRIHKVFGLSDANLNQDCSEIFSEPDYDDIKDSVATNELSRSSNSDSPPQGIVFQSAIGKRNKTSTRSCLL